MVMMTMDNITMTSDNIMATPLVVREELIMAVVGGRASRTCENACVPVFRLPEPLFGMPLLALYALSTAAVAVVMAVVV